MNKQDKFLEIIQELYVTYCAKNSDYGDSFGESFNKWGVLAPMVRISDKYNRLANLVGTNKEILVADEKIEDTLKDLANYCIMLIIELENSKKVNQYDIENYY